MGVDAKHALRLGDVPIKVDAVWSPPRIAPLTPESAPSALPTESAAQTELRGYGFARQVLPLYARGGACYEPAVRSLSVLRLLIAAAFLRIAGACDTSLPPVWLIDAVPTREDGSLDLDGKLRVLAMRAERGNLAPGERPFLLGSVEDYPGRSSRLRAAHQGLTSVLQSTEGSSRLDVRDLCSRLRVTRLDLTVLQATGLAAGGPSALAFPAGLKAFASGSRVPKTLRDAFRAAGTPLYVEYGAREAGGFTSTWPADRDPSIENVGSVVAGTELELVGADGAPARHGEIGEIRVRSAVMVGGYLRDAEATSRHFRDGWFHPGDLGSLTSHGSLVLHGRADDMMNLSGIKIFPAEIERVLESDASVKAAAAFAVPSAVYGDLPYAAVELHDAAARDVSALMARARARLGTRAPRKIIVVDALPRNSTGKVLRRALAALATGAGFRER